MAEKEPKEQVPDSPTVDREDYKDAIRSALRKWNLVGKPETAAKIREHLSRGEDPPRHLIFDSEIRPEKFVPRNLEIPPRAGPDATTDAWVEFALTTTDMEKEVVEKMTRKDIISMLEVKKVIPKEEKEE